MTYRDETAMDEACDVLEGEIASLEQQLDMEQRRGEDLDRDIARARKRLVIRRIKLWITRNPKSFAVLMLLLAAAGFFGISRTLLASDQRNERQTLMGDDCKTRLLVQASHAGAVVMINEVRMGTVPLDEQICPGTYRLRLVHDRTLPWQVLVAVKDQAKIEYHTRLAPRGSTTGTLVLSQPPGALLFVDGREAGWTPVFLDTPPGEAPMQLGLWRPGYRPAVWRLPRKSALWLHLGALQPEEAP